MTHGRPAWYDSEMRGRRLEAIFNQCNTKYWKETNEDLKETYFKRMMIIEKQILPYVEHMTGVKKVIAQSKKVADAQQIQLSV